MSVELVTVILCRLALGVGLAMGATVLVMAACDAVKALLR